MSKLCHCGQPLHYNDPFVQSVIEKLVAELGEYATVTCGGRSWLVPRHYIALHGVSAKELPTLGFMEINS